jgi:hypothetical protein
MLTATLAVNRTLLGTIEIQRIETHPTGRHKYSAKRYDANGRLIASATFHHDPETGAETCVQEALQTINTGAL